MKPGSDSPEVRPIPEPSQTSRFILWLLLGSAIGFVLIAIQAHAIGGWSGLLQVGERSRLLPFISSEIPDLIPVFGVGHDAQIYYAIGVDPLGRFVPDLVDHAGYRYRRILFPVLASLGGALRGKALVVGLVTWSTVGLGLMAGALRALTWPSRFPMILLFANPAVWLAVWMLTPEALALGLVLTGLWLWNRRPLIGWTLISLGALAKEQYLLAALVLAVWEAKSRRPIRAVAAIGAGLPLTLWSFQISRTLGEGFTPRGNLAPPFLGILNAAGVWPITSTVNQVYLVLALVGVVFALIVGWRTRDTLWGWLSLAWAGLAILSSDWVWNLGNNAARVFVGCWIFATCALTARRSFWQKGPGLG